MSDQSAVKHTSQNPPHVYLNPTMGRLVYDSDSRSWFVSPFFSGDLAANFLGVGVATVRNLVREGLLTKRHSGQYPYHVDDLFECAQVMKFNTTLAGRFLTPTPNKVD